MTKDEAEMIIIKAKLANDKITWGNTSNYILQFTPVANGWNVARIYESYVNPICSMNTSTLSLLVITDKEVFNFLTDHAYD